MIPGVAHRRQFRNLSEQEILALAISSEEDDARIYRWYAQQLRADYPQSAHIFEGMAREEDSHRAALIEEHVRRFGEAIPLLRREHVAGFYNRQGEFDKTIEALAERASREPDNPEAFQTLAAFYWEKAYRDFRLPDAQKQQYVDDGLVAVDKALAIKSDYLDAVAFKNLLLREKAKYVKDRAEYDKLIAEANRLQQRAVELQKKKTAGIS